MSSIRTKMFDLLIFLKSSGSNARYDNLYDTLISIKNNIGIKNYGFCIYIDKNMECGVRKIIERIGLSDKILRLETNDNPWFYDYNTFFMNYKDKTKWVMISHDDVEYRTSNFFEKTLNLVAGKEKEIGWITYTSDFYYNIMGRCLPNSVRCGFEKDIKNYPCVYECHNFVKSAHWDGQAKENLHLLDMPENDKLVKVHAPMSIVMISSVENLEKIGLCETWNKYTMLIDEDWGLSALRENLWNVWIPNIFITHPLRIEKRLTNNKYEKESHAGFIKKWGFDHPYNEKTIEYVTKKFGVTNIVWSIGRNTFDWSYL